MNGWILVEAILYHTQNTMLHGIQTAGKMVLGYLGKEIQVVLPSCAVNKIRTEFPSDQYVGFKI